MFSRHRRLIIVVTSVVVLLAVGFGMYQVVQNQMIAQARAKANGPAVTGVTSITIKNFAFSPAHVEIQVGTTITWTNDDTDKHNVTFDTLHVTSGLMAQGDVFKYTFTTPGDFSYRCSLHPAMLAMITVVAATP